MKARIVWEGTLREGDGNATRERSVKLRLAETFIPQSFSPILVLEEEVGRDALGGSQWHQTDPNRFAWGFVREMLKTHDGTPFSIQPNVQPGLKEHL